MSSRPSFPVSAFPTGSELLDIRQGVILNLVGCSGRMGAAGLDLRSCYPRQFQCFHAALEEADIGWERLLGQFRIGTASGLSIVHCFVRYGMEAAAPNALKEAFLGASKALSTPSLSGHAVYAPHRNGYHCNWGEWELCEGMMRRYFKRLVVVKHRPAVLALDRAV